jgi:outer membrane protein assembly factor BamB
MKFWTFLLLLFIFLSLIGTASAQLADSPWPTFRGNLKNTGLSPYNTSHVDGTIKWIFKPQNMQPDLRLLFDSSAIIGQDGTIYVGSHENNFYAINPDGTQKWMIDFGQPVLIVGGMSDGYKKGVHSSAAISADGTIYIRSFSNYLFAINPDGTEKWRYPVLVSADTWSSPTIDRDGTIYVGSSNDEENKLNGYVYAINPDGTLKWEFEGQSDIFPTAAIADDGTIYIGTGGDGHFYAINPDGTLKWNFLTGRHTESSVAIGVDGTLYFGNWDNKLYALDPEGNKKWEYLTGGGGIVASPAIAKDGTIYLTADDGYFYAFNPDGTVKWKYDTGDPAESSSSPTIGADGTIYFGIAWQPGKDHNFVALNPNGTLKWSELIDGIASSPTIGSDGTVYISTHSGLYAFGSSEEEVDGTETNTSTKDMNQTGSESGDRVTSEDKPEWNLKSIYIIGGIIGVIVITAIIFVFLR